MSVTRFFVVFISCAQWWGGNTEITPNLKVFYQIRNLSWIHFQGFVLAWGIPMFGDGFPNFDRRPTCSHCPFFYEMWWLATMKGPLDMFSLCQFWYIAAPDYFVFLHEHSFQMFHTHKIVKMMMWVLFGRESREEGNFKRLASWDTCISFRNKAPFNLTVKQKHRSRELPSKNCQRCHLKSA